MEVDKDLIRDKLITLNVSIIQSIKMKVSKCKTQEV
jgi:hypothetical protein